MRLADELRSKEKQPVESDPITLSQEDTEKQTRHNAIMSGSLTADLVRKIENVLRNDLYTSRLTMTPMDKNYTFHCIYKQSDYDRKLNDYRQKYIYSGDESTPKSVKLREQLNYHLLHRVFTLGEIECLKKQITMALSKEGFQVNCHIKEFKYKICNGLGLGIAMKSYGYIMDFTVRW